MILIVISRDPRTSGYRWIKDGNRPVSGAAGTEVGQQPEAKP